MKLQGKEKEMSEEKQEQQGQSQEQAPKKEKVEKKSCGCFRKIAITIIIIILVVSLAFEMFGKPEKGSCYQGIRTDRTDAAGILSHHSKIPPVRRRSGQFDYAHNWRTIMLPVKFLKFFLFQLRRN